MKNELRVNQDHSEKGQREKYDGGIRIWKIPKLHCSYGKGRRRTTEKEPQGNPIYYYYYYFIVLLVS